MDDGEKTEEPSAKKLGDAHAKGQFAKSQDVGTAFIVGAVVVVLVFSARDRATQICYFTIGIFSHLHDLTFNETNAAYILNEYARNIFIHLAPLLIAVTAASILAGGLQSGFRLSPKALESKIEKLNPVDGVKKLFSAKNLVQFAVDGAKFAATFMILYGLIHKIMNDPIFSSPVSLEYVGDFIYNLIVDMFTRLLLMLIVIAAIDYSWQRFKTNSDLKMTKQELKDELKNSDGDPAVKSARRRMAMKLLQQQMMKAVPTADVVVTNPTHFAVALKYERGKDMAPVVLAKGHGAFAQRIKALAREHGVPMVENKPVARMLYKVSQVGRTIPLELFEVVARILAHVYKTHRYYFHRLKARRLAAGLGE
jgi:flagellar biosynthetic protein FlhB